MPNDTTQLPAQKRDSEGSRAARRLRKEGFVPGVVYGNNVNSQPLQIDARQLRVALAHSGAVIELSIDGAGGEPVVVKDVQRHPVGGQTTHIDLLRVNLDRPIHATVTLTLQGTETAPGVKAGGVLEQLTRELNIEALPTAIPDTITFDIGEMEIHDSATLAELTVPEGTKLLDDESVILAHITPPRLAIEEEEAEVEEETEVVGEEGAEEGAAEESEEE